VLGLALTSGGHLDYPLQLSPITGIPNLSGGKGMHQFTLNLKSQTLYPSKE
jgi:hypothetical protein